MSSDQYTPSDEDMRWQYVVKRMHDGATRTHAEQEYTRWLAAHDARVRRDAAREALDGLAREAAGVAEAANAAKRDKPWVARTVQGWAEDYRDTHYPEETP